MIDEMKIGPFSMPLQEPKLSSLQGHTILNPTFGKLKIVTTIKRASPMEIEIDHVPQMEGRNLKMSRNA